MNRHIFSKWLLATAGISLMALCQSCSCNKNAGNTEQQKQSDQTQQGQPACQPSSGDAGCEKECREDECDYQEGGEEGAMIHVIEIEEDETPATSLSEELNVPTPTLVNTKQTLEEAKIELPSAVEPASLAAEPAKVEATESERVVSSEAVKEEPSESAKAETSESAKVETSEEVAKVDELSLPELPSEEVSEESSLLDPLPITPSETSTCDVVKSALSIPRDAV